MAIIPLPGLSDGQGVYIIEDAAPWRTLSLVGRDRPEAPVDRELETRSKQTWYPGSSVASTHVMGAMERPVILRGWFQDPLTLLTSIEVSPGFPKVVNYAPNPNGPVPGSLRASGPQAQMAILRGLLYSMGPCRLQWGDVILCKGRVTRVRGSIFREARIRYEIVFEVDQSDEAVSLSAPPSSGTLFDLQAAALEARESMGVVVGVADTVKTIGAIIL